MEDGGIRDPAPGRNQQGARAHNERLVLSMIQRHGSLAGGAIARRAGLSAQTISVILRKLEQDGLVLRGDPVRGRVGKPSVPMRLAPDGAFSVGMKIGRRSVDLVLVDFAGAVRARLEADYPYPMPGPVVAFLRDGLAAFADRLGPRAFARVAGIGVAKPYEIWNWHESVGAPDGVLAVWRTFDLAAEIATLTPLPVFVENDATAACRAELASGRGRTFRDFAYFFIGAFAGGGVVLGNSVYEGRRGNAGAFGSLTLTGPGGEARALIDAASLHLLGTALRDAGLAPALRGDLPDWNGFPAILGAWIEDTAFALARAILSVCAVIDFEAVVIDGGFPAPVRSRLVARTRAAFAGLDKRGLYPPEIVEGSVGWNARALGAATAPILAQYLLDTHGDLRGDLRGDHRGNLRGDARRDGPDDGRRP